MTIHRATAAEENDDLSGPPESQSCRDLVEQAEILALTDEPLHISALCRTLQVSERTLRKAFHKIHRIPPCRRLRWLRMYRARRALQSADRRLATVTGIATHFGFMELGRFSVEYRSLFGESPSQTLHPTTATKAHPMASDAFNSDEKVGLWTPSSQE